MEVRLNDSKRQLVKVGHFIEFIDTSNASNKLRVKVLRLSSYDSFHELYSNESFEKMGCFNWSMERMVEETYDIYSTEQERNFGALAIEVEKN
ncbi:ASCH domain-containing protein [Exiguobacterium sp. SH0S1]|uniref:ASCH domain-containing protein n=1 Tax=Exiguobacterium sp. SH0S1 TaxID=2510949 RepID=UPI003FA56CA4